MRCVQCRFRPDPGCPVLSGVRHAPAEKLSVLPGAGTVKGPLLPGVRHGIDHGDTRGFCWHRLAVAVRSG